MCEHGGNIVCEQGGNIELLTWWQYYIESHGGNIACVNRVAI